MLPQCPLREIACQQIMAEDASVFSVQWADLPVTTVGALSAEELLYRITQAAIHRMVTVRFLSLLYHELVGPSGGVRVANVAVRAGKPV